MVGKTDDIILPELTKEWFTKNSVGQFKIHFENIGHRTPVSILDKYIKKNENKSYSKIFETYLLNEESGINPEKAKGDDNILKSVVSGNRPVGWWHGGEEELPSPLASIPIPADTISRAKIMVEKVSLLFILFFLVFDMFGRVEILSIGYKS